MIETALPLSIPPTFTPFLISIAAMLVTLVYGCIEDLKDRSVPAVMWYPALVIGIICLVYFVWETKKLENIVYLLPIFCMMIFFIIAFYLFAYFHLFGLGDAKALMTVTICIPIFPLVPLFGYPPYGIAPYAFFPLSMFTNTVLMTIFAPLSLFLYNLCKRNIAPISTMFLGIPVPSKTLLDTYGIVMENFEIQDGTIQRQFIGFRAALYQMITGKGRVYTKDLRENPKKYAKQLELYNQVDSIWISHALPYLIPITIGFIVTLICGDLIYAILERLF
ncbi:MAG: prepilin peptidase [Methanomicrobiales archaeon]|jgi:preflagellin peptidase FlaK|nr:prepilin peptidase [Methanomicrobiales archaeon]